MPVVDPEFLLAISPLHPKHEAVTRRVRELENLMVTDTCLLWLQALLAASGKRPSQARLALLTLRQLLEELGVREVNTISSEVLALQAAIMARHKLGFFRSLLAASAIALNEPLLSDDTSYDVIAGLKRIPLTPADEEDVGGDTEKAT